jgi:hypothetical protein
MPAWRPSGSTIGSGKRLPQDTTQPLPPLPGGATQCHVTLLVEYVAGENFTLNTDIVASIAPNGHGTYEAVTLVDGGRSMIGIIDTFKWVHVLYGTRVFTGTVGTVFKSLVETANGKYICLHGNKYDVV